MRAAAVRWARMMVTCAALGLVAAMTVESAGQASAEPPPGWTTVDLGAFGPLQLRSVYLNDEGTVTTLRLAEDGTQRAMQWSAERGTRDLTPLAIELRPRAMNGRGDVVGIGIGQDAADAGLRSFRWRNQDGLVAVGRANGLSAHANAINDAGVVVGEMGSAGGHLSPFRAADDQAVLLPLPEGMSGGSAGGVNAAGTIAGNTYGASGEPHATVWEADAPRLLEPHGATSSSVLQLNDRGSVLGWWQDGAASGQMLWTATHGFVNLPPAVSASLPATALNNADQVAFTTLEAGRRATYRFTPGAELQPIPGGAFDIFAAAISDSGMVAGRILTDRGFRAFAWTEASGTVELGTLAGGRFSMAEAVNAAGQVVGLADGPDGQLHTVVWNPPSLGMSPGTPVDFDATRPGTGVWLSWRPAGTNTLGFDLIRARWDDRIAAWGQWTTLVAGGTATTFVDDEAGAGYYAYLVRAYNLDGKSLWATKLIWQASDPMPPAAPSDAVATAAGREVTVRWQDHAANELGYDILRVMWFPAYRTWGDWQLIQAAADATAVTDSLPRDGRFAYLIRARNPAGASAWAIAAVDFTADSEPPPAPTDLRATSGFGVELTWHDTAAHEHGYEIIRAVWDGHSGVWGSWAVLAGANADATTFTDTSAPDGRLAYLVRAFNGNGASAWTLTTLDVVGSTPIFTS